MKKVNCIFFKHSEEIVEKALIVNFERAYRTKES